MAIIRVEHIGKVRKYCTKCGLTWFAKGPAERCPDCNPPSSVLKQQQARVALTNAIIKEGKRR